MINVAVLGTGKIIPEAVEAFRASNKFRVVNIWARPHSRDKAAALAEKFGVEKFTTDLDDIANDPAVDFVYVGLVNAVHCEYAKKFLDAGKNVIVEKPFTSTAAQAQDLVDVALRKKLFLFEAITTLHLPNFGGIRDALSKIGDVKLVQCNFSQYSSRYDAYKKMSAAASFDPKSYGGALMDINIYNLNFVVGLFGAPKKVSCVANFGWNGVDTSNIVTLEYENFLAQCVAAKDSGSPSFVCVQGDGGYILSTGTPNELNSFELAVRGQDVQKFSLNDFGHRMVYQFVDFAEIFERGDFAAVERGLKTSLDVMTVAERAAKSAGIVYG